MPAQNQSNKHTLLAHLLSEINGDTVQENIVITGVAADSRALQTGYLFLALPGSSHHGLDFLPQVIEAGAAAVCYELHDPRFDDTVQTAVDEAGLVAIPIKNIIQQAGIIAARFYQHPSADPWVIGVTGTDGKTSVTQIIAQALHSETTVSGVIGTLGSGLFSQLETTGMTTPDAVSLQKTFAHFAEQHAHSVAMEVSSHALAQSRTNGVDFDIAVLTNIGRDHLDYHGDLKTYRETKLSFFQRPGLKHLVINLDDPAGQALYAQKQGSVQVHGYSQNSAIQNNNVIKATDINTTDAGLSFIVKTSNGTCSLHSKLMGRFNVSNLLAAFCTLRAMGFNDNDIATRLSKVAPIPGRMELFKKPACPTILVDYAHTPQALETALLAAREHCSGKLWCVFGCGGDRDTGKRPLMAAAAEQYADQIIVTDDNPRNENGDAIVNDMLRGLKQPLDVSIERNREAAIVYAFNQAAETDLILIAGKGHETYQQVGEEKLSFSDRHYVQQLLDGQVSRPLLSELAEACEGRLVKGDVGIENFCTDTRAACSGSVFFALTGERFDGHRFISQAIEKGAIALVVEQPQAVSVPQLIVSDTVKALGKLAALWRSKFDVPVFGITGSNGKTTTKEMLAAILRQKGQVLATAGNFNNEIGLPLTLLKLHERHQYVVLEHGASKAGDIAYLSEISQPSVALVTNAGHAHLAGFGSVEGVARAKAEIYQNIKPDGIAVVNIDDAYASTYLQASSHAKQVTFGFSAEADVQGQFSDSQFTVSWQAESCHINLQLLGQHNRLNALAAIAAAVSIGVSLDESKRGLESLAPIPGRLELKSNNKFTIVDDSYNANPDSFKAAISTLIEQGENTCCVMGDMAELGEDSAESHRDIGLFARELGVRTLLALGPQSALAAEAFGSGGHTFEQLDLLLAWINTHVTSNTVLLIKGSRSAQMERVVEQLLAVDGAAQNGGAI